jgi:hypothetical protein
MHFPARQQINFPVSMFAFIQQKKTIDTLLLCSNLFFDFFFTLRVSITSAYAQRHQLDVQGEKKRERKMQNRLFKIQFQ